MLILIQRMENIISLKNAPFSGKGRQLLHAPYMRIRKMLISCIKLDHALYLINYGILICTIAEHFYVNFYL